MFGGLNIISLYPLKWQLPLLNDFCGLFEMAYLITFPIEYATRERLGGSSCLFYTPVQESQAVVYSCL